MLINDSNVEYLDNSSKEEGTQHWNGEIVIQIEDIYELRDTGNKSTSQGKRMDAQFAGFCSPQNISWKIDSGIIDRNKVSV